MELRKPDLQTKLARQYLVDTRPWSDVKVDLFSDISSFPPCARPAPVRSVPQWMKYPGEHRANRKFLVQIFLKVQSHVRILSLERARGLVTGAGVLVWSSDFPYSSAS